MLAHSASLVHRPLGSARALLLGCTLVTATAAAGPPLETDDPATPGPGRWEVAFAAEIEARGSDREIVPLADINHGYGEHIQLKVKPRLAIVDSPTGTGAGLGNMQLGLKWRFFADESRRRSLSIYPQVDFNPPGNSDDRGLVEDGTQFFLPLEVAQSIGGTSLYAEIGFNWREHGENEWVAGIAVEQPVSARLVIVAELREIAVVGGRDYELSTRAGCKWRPRERWALLASIGRTLHEFEGERRAIFSYIGMQQTF